MARFDAPNPTYEAERNAQWSKAAPPGMRSPDHLWGEYWQRFNTFSIPISDSNGYFAIAMTVAKVSKNKADFERRFAEENERRLHELHSVLNDMFWDIPRRSPFLVEKSDARQLSCLEHFVRVSDGYILARKADTEPAKIVVEKQESTAENSLQEKGQIVIEDELETLIGETSRSPSADSDDEEYLRPERLSHEDEYFSQFPCDVDWGYKLNEEHKARRVSHRESDAFMRTNFESLMPASDDFASYTLNSDDDTPSIQQVPSLTSNDSQDLEKGNESLATQDGLRKRSSVSSKSRSLNSAKKRIRFDADEDISTHEPKRRKLENTSAHAETSPTRQTTRGSSIQAANGSASRKRSRSDEDEEDNGFKRQKIESLPRPPSPLSIASSAEDESTDHLARGNSEKVPDKEAPESNNGRPKRRKQKPTSPTSRAKSSRNTLHTRSSRRVKSSTLWELDSSGKPRLT
ncbi:hypothetical protein ACHAPV_003136 [Trichoderma viride]